MNTREMIKLAARGLVVEPKDMEKLAIEPMVGGIPPPPPAGMPPMDPMAGGGMPTMPGAGGPPMPPMDPSMMGASPMGGPPMDPMAGGMPPLDPAMMASLMGGAPGGEGAPPEGAPPAEVPPEEEVNDPLTDVDNNNKRDTMVPLEAITEHDVALIEATKGKRTADAAPPEAGGGAMPSLGPGSIGGPPSPDAMPAMPKMGEILLQMDDDLR